MNPSDFQALLEEVNKNIGSTEERFIQSMPENHTPILFFCMAPRTGSTIISQLLSLTGEFSYITNFTARFWDAPYFAMNLEKQLKIRDLQFSNSPETLHSQFGVTEKVWEPHEYGHFWKKYLPTLTTNFLKLQDIKTQQISQLKQEVWAMLSVYEQPFFFKNAQISLNPDVLSQIFPNAKFLVLKRDPFAIAQSILKVREEKMGSRLNWWSMKPSNYEAIIEKYQKSPIDQVVLQIKGIYQDIHYATENIREKCLTLHYESFCHNPPYYLGQIFKLLGHQPSSDWETKIPDQLQHRDKSYLSESDAARLKTKISEHQLAFT